jgi:hypothetical protein
VLNHSSFVCLVAIPQPSGERVRRLQKRRRLDHAVRGPRQHQKHPRQTPRRELEGVGDGSRQNCKLPLLVRREFTLLSSFSGEDGRGELFQDSGFEQYGRRSQLPVQHGVPRGAPLGEHRLGYQKQLLREVPGDKRSAAELLEHVLVDVQEEERSAEDLGRRLRAAAALHQEDPAGVGDGEGVGGSGEVSPYGEGASQMEEAGATVVTILSF